MSLFFDADWFDARLGECGLSRAALAEAAGLSAAELHRIFVNERAATGEELTIFSERLGADLVEVSLRAGVSDRSASPSADASERIASIEARLDAVDAWIAELEQKRKRA